nr:hypothetical protein Itr_chr04CG22280 [Ipomoea trifida]
MSVKFEEVEFRFIIFRERNKVADAVAKLTREHPSDSLVFSVPLASLVFSRSPPEHPNNSLVFSVPLVSTQRPFGVLCSSCWFGVLRSPREHPNDSLVFSVPFASTLVTLWCSLFPCPLSSNVKGSCLSLGFPLHYM